MKSTTIIWIAFIFSTISLAVSMIEHWEVNLDFIVVWILLDVATFLIMREEKGIKPKKVSKQFRKVFLNEK